MPTNIRRVLALPGYTNQSVWGYDESLQSYFATIWADTSSGDEEPDIWIMGMPAISTEVELAAIIAWKVDVEPADVLSAMHMWDGVEGKVAEGNRGAWWHKLFCR